jgi:hypothetical protein
MPAQKREARLRARRRGHPRLETSAKSKTWMAGTSPAMTETWVTIKRHWYHREPAQISDSNFKEQGRHTAAIPRRDSPESCTKHSPREIRGRRESRVRAAPAVSCAKDAQKNAHEHTGTDGAFRLSPRNGFTAYTVLSPATNSSCHRRWRISGSTRTRLGSQTSASLTPATGARTTRFCRTR